MAYRTHPSQPASANDIEDYWKARARSFLGITSAKNMLWDMHLFAARHSNGYGPPTGTGTTGLTQATRYNCTGGDVTRGGFNTASTAIIQANSAKKWYIAGRFRLTSATYENGSHGGLGVGTGGAGETLVCGVRGATSTTNFFVWGNNGTTIDSGLAIDTVERTHEFYRNGTTGFYYIDEVLRGSGDSQPTADATCVAVAAAAAAVNRSIEFVWIAVAAELD